MESLKRQHGGSHYEKMNIQPLEFCAKNMTHEEIKGVVKKDVLKYLWREKDGVAVDWSKAKHLIEWGLEALGCKIDKTRLYFFPRAKFANVENGDEQLKHMMTEACEFIEAYTNWFNDPSAEKYKLMIDESTDFVHSRETYSRIDAVKLEMLTESEQRVIEKNRARGYYDE